MTAVLSHLQAMGRVMLLALPLWLLLRSLFLLSRQRAPRWGREALLALFALYVLALAFETLTPGYPGFRLDDTVLTQALQRWRYQRAINLTPGATILAFWHRGSAEQQLINLAGNVLVFVPLGFLPPLLWHRWRSWWRAALLCAGASLSIEFLQLFLSRSVDVDDLILNVLGGLLGWILWALLWAILPKKWKLQ